MNTHKIENTAPGGNGIESNHLISLAGNQKAFDISNYAEQPQDLQANLLAVMKPARKIVRLHRCFGCKRNFSIKKMSSLLIFCRNCFAAAQDKKQIARRNFIDRALNECRIFLGVRI